MYCPKCGKPVGDGLAFCPECSASLVLPAMLARPTATAGQDAGLDSPVPLRLGATAARAGVIVGIVVALFLALSFIAGEVDDPIRDSDTAYGLGILTVLFVLLNIGVGYVTRSNGFALGFGAGLSCAFPLGALICAAVSAGQHNPTGIVIWLFIAVVIAASLFAYRGLLARSAGKRTDHSRPAPAGTSRCPRCGAQVESTWTTCRGCAAALVPAGVQTAACPPIGPVTIAPGLDSNGATPSEGLGKTVMRGITKAVVWLTAGR
jgi:hypothetical protein